MRRLSDFFTVMDLKKYFWASLFLAIICLAGAVLAVMSSGDADIFKTTVGGHGDLYVREQFVETSSMAQAMVDNAEARYVSLVEVGEIAKFSNSFRVHGAQVSGGFKNQYFIRGAGEGNTFKYMATAIVGDFFGGSELILRGAAHQDQAGNVLESRITLDSSGGKSIFDIDVINVSTGRPVTAFELNSVGNWTFQQYLALNMSEQEKFSEEDFCESLDRILPRDFSGYYIAPHGKKLTTNADLVDHDVDEANITEESTIARFAAEQAEMDEYRSANPGEFLEEDESEV